MGFADVGCFGNNSLETPNVDRLCKEGIKLTHHLSAYSLCTPSRVSALTGRYAGRFGMAQSFATLPVVIYTAGRVGLPPNSTAWPKLLKEDGYRTGAFGKWHMGWNKEKWGDQLHGPLGHGFDFFLGIPFTLVDGFEKGANESFFSVTELRKALNGTMPPRMEGTLHLIKEMMGGGEVFSLALTGLLGMKVLGVSGRAGVVGGIGWWFAMQHLRVFTEKWWQRSDYMEGLLNSNLMEMPGDKVMMQPMDQTRSSSLINKRLQEFIQEKSSKPWVAYYSLTEAHTPLIVEQEFRGRSSHGDYGDTILQMDAMVGRILDMLDTSGQAENTLVYYTSDHGGHIDIGNKGGWNAPFTGGKGNGAREGGVRVPGIVRFSICKNFNI